ncbi:MAG TPA: hypothetical protein PKY78_06100 [Candidatus Omnitrophota bacterium]|nr:hypothetical protein [Candidatus Omnitrophota bacterium]
MKNKEKVLKLLEKCVHTEDSVIPVVSEHISNTLFLSGLREKDADVIKSVLNTLRSDSERHRRMFQHAVEKVRG